VWNCEARRDALDVKRYAPWSKEQYDSYLRNYPTQELGDLGEVVIRCNDFKDTLISTPRIKSDSEFIEFKGGQLNLFHYVIAAWCKAVLEQGRTSEVDDLISATNSLYTLAIRREIQNRFVSKSDKARERARLIGCDMPTLRRKARKDINRLCKIGFLREDPNHNIFLTGRSFEDLSGHRVFLPDPQLLVQMRDHFRYLRNRRPERQTSLRETRNLTNVISIPVSCAAYAGGRKT
jgi:hypothetical protein